MGLILPKKHGVGDPTHLFNPYQILYLCVKADYSIDVIQALAKLIIEEDWFPLYGLGPLSLFTGTPDPLVEVIQAILAWSFYKYVTIGSAPKIYLYQGPKEGGQYLGS